MLRRPPTLARRPARPASSSPSSPFPRLPVGPASRPRPAPIPLPGRRRRHSASRFVLRAHPSAKLLIPPGATGNLEPNRSPSPGRCTPRRFSSSREASSRGHGEGTTSADFGRGLIFATGPHATQARRAATLHPGASSPKPDLRRQPRLVRWVASTGEIWVTQPDKDRIGGDLHPPHLLGRRARAQGVRGRRRRAGVRRPVRAPSRPPYTTSGRTRVGRFPGLEDAGLRRRGRTAAPIAAIALDAAARGLLFAGLAPRAKAVVLDLLHDGAVRGPTLRRLAESHNRLQPSSRPPLPARGKRRDDGRSSASRKWEVKISIRSLSGWVTQISPVDATQRT